MRYVKKVNTPEFFTPHTHNLKKWGKYDPKKKRVLKNHILKHEQNYLCIYCESRIHEETSHIEHIKPQSRYPSLTFEYKNLVVSCEGNCHNQENDDTKHTCGHIKSNEYDEKKFLNPVEIPYIREYFKYDANEFSIFPSAKDNSKANYMINTLSLNDNGLAEARKKALTVFIKKISPLKINERKEKMKLILNNKNIAFISFLRFYVFKHNKQIKTSS